MKSTEFHPGDYDVHGRLRLPFLFWCVLLLQARTWVLFVMAGASRGQGDTLLNLFYPDHDAFWLGLLPGVPAVLAFLCSGRRQFLCRAAVAGHESPFTRLFYARVRLKRHFLPILHSNKR